MPKLVWSVCELVQSIPGVVEHKLFEDPLMAMYFALSIEVVLHPYEGMEFNPIP